MTAGAEREQVAEAVDPSAFGKWNAMVNLERSRVAAVGATIGVAGKSPCSGSTPMTRTVDQAVRLGAKA
jgi:hypothetical protein